VKPVTAMDRHRSALFRIVQRLRHDLVARGRSLAIDRRFQRKKYTQPFRNRRPGPYIPA
jgi:hypothetical protein